eukprot:m.54293 g.54293  ORF g.54293 m.54293 type:complete len:342 (+) comp12452_c0_seq1:123-1148(+)
MLCVVVLVCCLLPGRVDSNEAGLRDANLKVNKADVPSSAPAGLPAQPVQLQRYRQVSKQQALELLEQAQQPFVVEDVVRGGKDSDPWPLDHWTFNALIARFGSKVRNRRIDIGEPMFGDKGEFLGLYNPTAEEWAQLNRDLDESDKDARHIAWQLRNMSDSEQLQTLYVPPYFLPSVPGNTNVSKHNARETVFIALDAGEAREPHIDFSCASVWSAQLHGKKRWTLRAPDDPEGVMSQQLGTQLDPHQQPVPPFEATLVPGDLLVWFPGWTHHTTVLEGPSVALSAEFAVPPPLGLVQRHRNLFDRHVQQLDSFDCWQGLQQRVAQYVSNKSTKDPVHEEL